MRSLLIALFLTLAFAGTSHAQERVRDAGAPAARPTPTRTVPAAVTRQANVRAGVRKDGLAASRAQAARRQSAPRVKRPAAPRS
jgi:hypothetical protein